VGTISHHLTFKDSVPRRGILSWAINLEPESSWRRRDSSPHLEGNLPSGSALWLQLAKESLELGVVLQCFEVGILEHPVDVVVAEGYGLAEGLQGGGALFAQGQAAGQIVVGGGVVRVEAHQLAIHLQAVGDATDLGVEAAEQAHDLGVIGTATLHGLVKLNFKLRIGSGRLGHGLADRSYGLLVMRYLDRAGWLIAHNE